MYLRHLITLFRIIMVERNIATKYFGRNIEYNENKSVANTNLIV